ncbi:MAG TPA: CDP-alcohol phosphatidyltransferase family protein [bacterium]
MGWKQARADYRRMAKPRAVEEVGDIYLIRPLGFLIVQALRRTPVTPTQVSVLAVLAGWLSAWFYFESARRGTVATLAVLGALALLLHSALDSADGQLARLKSMQTPLGRIVDGFCDNLSFLAIYLAIICGGWERAGTHAPLLLALAAAAGASHSVQSSLVEYQRTLYLHYVHGKTDVVDAQPERLRHSAPSGAGAALLQAVHRAYYHQQRFFLSSSAALERAITHWRHRHPRLAGALAPRYEAGQRPLLPWWALMASNSHKAGIVVAAFLPVGAGSFWAGLGMGWYLVYVLLLNLALLALIPAQRRRDRRLAAELETLAASGAGA